MFGAIISESHLLKVVIDVPCRWSCLAAASVRHGVGSRVDRNVTFLLWLARVSQVGVPVQVTLVELGWLAGAVRLVGCDLARWGQLVVSIGIHWCLKLRLRVDQHHLLRSTATLSYRTQCRPALWLVSLRVVLCRLVILVADLLGFILLVLTTLAPTWCVCCKWHRLLGLLHELIARELLVDLQIGSLAIAEHVLLDNVVVQWKLLFNMVATLTDNFGRSGFRNKIGHHHAVVKSLLRSGSILVWDTTNRSETRSWLLELPTMKHFLSFRILVQRWFKRFLDCTIARLFLSHHLLTRSVLKDTRRVVWISHQRVDKGVDLGLFPGNCRIFGRLILDLEFGVLWVVVALVDALLARAIPHVHGCRIDDLRGYTSHSCSVRVRF